MALRPNRAVLAPADILRVATVSDAQISPSGEWVVYSVSTTEGDQTVNNLWLARIGETLGESAHQPATRATAQLGRATQFPPDRCFLGLERRAIRAGRPDGKTIAFIATHDGQRGIWVTGPNRRPAPIR